MTSTAWTREQVARELLGEREQLQQRLPGEIHAARDLEEWVREDIVAAAITHIVMDHPRPIHSRDELERTLWAACAHRVRRAHEGRYDLVRGRFHRASAAVLDSVADEQTPEQTALERENLAHALDFAAMLTPLERRVHSAKYLDGERERGYKQIARALGETIGAVRAAERAIGIKQERFAAILSAGRLCDFQAPAIASLAAGDATEHQATAAHVHLQGCATCRTHYKRHLRYLRTARFHGRVNELLPPVTLTSDRRTGVRDLVADWAARLLGHDAPATATQLAAGGTGRGIGTAAALKLASLCLGAGTLGLCAATGVVPLGVGHHEPPAKAATPAATPTSTPVGRATAPARRRRRDPHADTAHDDAQLHVVQDPGRDRRRPATRRPPPPRPEAARRPAARASSTRPTNPDPRARRPYPPRQGGANFNEPTPRRHDA